MSSAPVASSNPPIIFEDAAAYKAYADAILASVGFWFGTWHFDPDQMRVDHNGSVVFLTPRQSDLLALLVTAAPLPKSTRDLASALHTPEDQVRSLVQVLRRKIGNDRLPFGRKGGGYYFIPFPAENSGGQ